MKTIKAIMAVLLLAIGTAAQAERKVIVKANDGNTGQFQLNSRIVIDLTKDRPVVRNNTSRTVYQQDADFVLLIDGDLEDAIKTPKTDVGKDEVLYDLSGRKIVKSQRSMVNGQLPRGIYIKNGKKVVLK